MSDKGSRKWVIQFSLVLSALATLWLAFQGAYLPFLMLNLLLYGVVTRSRMTLTQAMVSDSLPEADRENEMRDKKVEYVNFIPNTKVQIMGCLPLFIGSCAG